MTTPYGPYGRPSEQTPPPGPPPFPPQGQPAPYGGPAAYGRPGPYGPPPQHPGFPPGGYGMPPQPPRQTKGLLPWLVAGTVALVAGVGLLLFLLFSGDDERPTGTQAATSTSSSSSSSSAPAPSPPAEPSGEAPVGDLPGGARVAEPSDDGGGQFAGSGEVALAWVQALAEGEFQTAYDLSCADVQDAAAAAAVGNTEDPAWELATFFYEQTLGGVGFSSGTFDSLSPAAGSNQDLATFTLQMQDGSTFTLLVYVGQDLTVCDFF